MEIGKNPGLRAGWLPGKTSRAQRALRRIRPMLLSAAALACGGEARGPEVLQLLQKRPKETSGVYLNEHLVFHFSKKLDRTSVNRASVRIAASDGRAPRGEILVEGNELRFVPAPVLASDLSDGGYLPETEYTVRFLGFPSPDGLRAEDGAPLERTEMWTFRTVPVAEPRTGLVFEDASPEVGLPIQMGAGAVRVLREVPPTGPITLEGGEPIDPSTFVAEDFELREVSQTAIGEPIPLRARLADNRERGGLADGRTLLQLWPERLLRPGAYFLGVKPERVHLRDFGGHPVWPFSIRRLDVEVVERRVDASASSFVVSFLETALRSSAEVPEADGTARWSHTGRVEVRFPAAAGSGKDGSVVISGEEPRRDLHAVSLRVPAEAESWLSGAAGTVVLRAQERLTVDGKMLRRSGGERLALPERGALSDWLAELAQRDANCTVLIAGGDLTIRGSIDVDGPLVLIAGGRIRCTGKIRLGANTQLTMDEFIKARIEGGAWLFNQQITDKVDVALELPLTLDPPEVNPLREPLRLQVFSAPIPPSGRVARWRSASVGGHKGTGRYRVRFIGERAGVEGASEEIAVDDPRLLIDCKALRLSIELEVLPQTVWDPPWVHHVEVSWDETGPEDAR